jgi:methylenetetrahydrofolate dehydrogenase (NADP+)/methenyltetrahydrofolate cyclohydrolase
VIAEGKILDGRQLAQSLKDQLREEVEGLKARTGRVPRLINIMLGSEPGSCAYARSQQRVAEQVGIQYDLLSLPAAATQLELEDCIRTLNDDPLVNGVMIHKPVPAYIDYQAAANCLDIRKDLEGINVANIGKMLLGETRIIPCTPAAVMEHLKFSGQPLRGRETVIVGSSNIVGKPLSLLLLREMATVTMCHIATSEAGHLQEHIRRADILIVAVGRPELVRGEWVKEGAVVIDVGINAVEGRIVGDVEFAAARRRAALITPVPGGVGPVTVMMLMRNGIEAFKQQVG